MNISEYILNDLTPIKSNSKISELQSLLNNLTYSHIPVQDENGVFLGCFFETDVHCFDANKKLSDYIYTLEDFFVRMDSQWLDILEAFAVNSANIMPVLDSNNKYLGYYELKDIIGLFSETPFFSEAGEILVVEKGINDYSFSEISQIIESNNGNLFGAFISKMDKETVQITLKISSSGFNDIIQTFRRYNYILVSGHEEDSYINDLKDRSNYLNKYLNI